MRASHGAFVTARCRDKLARCRGVTPTIRHYLDDDGGKQPRRIIFSVKGGHLKVNDIRALGHFKDREKADFGASISFEKPRKLKRREAAAAGFYTSPWGKHPRLQLLTVEKLLGGSSVSNPRTARVNQTFKQAPRATAKADSQPELYVRNQ